MITKLLASVIPLRVSLVPRCAKRLKVVATKSLTPMIRTHLAQRVSILISGPR